MIKQQYVMDHKLIDLGELGSTGYMGGGWEVIAFEMNLAETSARYGLRPVSLGSAARTLDVHRDAALAAGSAILTADDDGPRVLVVRSNYKRETIPRVVQEYSFRAAPIGRGVTYRGRYSLAILPEGENWVYEKNKMRGE